MNLDRKKALVTGANRGIGFELCRQLAADGASVIAGVRRNAQETREALTAEGFDVAILFIDTSDIRSVQTALARLQEPIDILINNAAILDRGSILGLSDEEVDRVIRTNLIGPMLLATNLSHGMTQRKWGRIVNVTSGMGAISRGLGSDSVAYRVSKLALNGFTICLSDALRKTGVLVNSVDPGWVRTEMGGSMAHRTAEDAARSVLHAVHLPDNGPSGVFFRNGKHAEW